MSENGDNAAADIEAILEQLTSQISQVQDIPVLLQAATGLGRDVPEESKLNKRAIKKIINRFLNGDDVEVVPDVMVILTGLHEMLNRHLNPEPNYESQSEMGSNVNERIEENNGAGGEVNGRNHGTGFPPANFNIPDVKEPFQFGALGGLGLGGFGGVPPNLTRNQSLNDGRANFGGGAGRVSGHNGNVGNAVGVVPVAAHRLREFKIHGKIGEPQEDDGKTTKEKDACLSYSNVILQINDGVAAGYEDREICSAVVRATTDASLRDYIVERIVDKDLDVAGLRKVLATHFKAQDSTEVYNQMITRSQKPGENAMKFVQEMMKLRKMTLRLSKADGGSYTKELVQKQFQKSVYNGLRDSSIRLALRTTLKLPVVSDEDLRDEIKDLMLNEADHESKMDDDKKDKSASVNQIDSRNAVNQAKSKKDPVVAQVTQQFDSFKVGMTKDMTDFKQAVLDKLTPNNNSHTTNNGQQAQTGYAPQGATAAGGFNVQSQAVPVPGQHGAGAMGANYFPPQCNPYPAFYGAGIPGYPAGYFGYPGYGYGTPYDGGFDGNTPGGNSSNRGGAATRGGHTGGGSNGGRGGNKGGNNDGNNNNNRGGNRGGNRRRNGRLNKPVTMCDICSASNALFCNHCHICGNVDHVSWGCPHKDDPNYQKK